MEEKKDYKIRSQTFSFSFLVSHRQLIHFTILEGKRPKATKISSENPGMNQNYRNPATGTHQIGGSKHMLPRQTIHKCRALGPSPILIVELRGTPSSNHSQK